LVVEKTAVGCVRLSSCGSMPRCAGRPLSGCFEDRARTPSASTRQSVAPCDKGKRKGSLIILLSLSSSESASFSTETFAFFEEGFFVQYFSAHSFSNFFLSALVGGYVLSAVPSSSSHTTSHFLFFAFRSLASSSFFLRQSVKSCNVGS